ncbi:nardilysin-like [Aristolochia californica]|uniref:nardilysin-like n=1 Tax=Aristolochia californica TaxID=171875 RepID=UPI0035D9128E
MGGCSPDDVVIKSPTDRRLYRVIQLPNCLTALLIHDPEILRAGLAGDPEVEDDNNEGQADVENSGSEDEDDNEGEESEGGEEEEGEEEDGEEEENGSAPTKKAAAAMCVGVGSFLDPVEAQGLAHFLEHMLFMGSSEFPDENEYDSYLSKHGGSSNAYTETEYTCYYFEVNREYLKGALDRFSQFFVSPLIKSEAMEREVLAVDSEFNQVIQNDNGRLQQLQCHTAFPGHPLNRFFWGNKKSLSDALEKGINLREKIMQLYRDNYRGELMKLVVIGGEPLDILEDWVFNLFGTVKRGGHINEDKQMNIPIWKSGKLYRLEAVKDVNILHLSWTLPCLDKEYLKKPEDYLAHLLGHEGRGSVLFFLKDKGWATSLSAGVGDEGMYRSSLAYVFVMSIHLTESGLEQVYEVIGVVYQYLKLLRQVGPQEWVFKELQDIGNMEFRFAEEQSQDDYAVELAENLLVYSVEDVIYGEYVFKVWDSELVEHVLGFFTPENMRVDLASKSFNLQLEGVQSEPWFGTPYIEDEISASVLKTWRDPPVIDPDLHLPPKNNFIPCDFTIRRPNPMESTSIAANLEHPICLIDEPLVKLWYKPDWIFNVPRANTYFLINVKDGYKSVQSCVLTELFVNLLKDKLNDVLYQAGVAKLETSLAIIGDKLELKLFGFNDKLQVLLIQILNISKSFSPSADRFKVIKEDMERSYRNANMKPLTHATYLRLQALRQKFWDVDDKLSCLRDLTLLDLKAFIPELLSQLHIEGLCHGNLSADEAKNVSIIFKNAFSVQPLPVEMRHQENILSIASGASFIRNVSVKNKLETNSVVELYFQIEPDVGLEATRLRAIADLFDEIIEEPYFNQLRTKEQLGYTVQSGTRMTYRVLGFCFLVQSSDYDPIYLHERINHFISSLQELLEGLDAESFENYRASLIEQKLEKHPSLIHETDHHWTQIVDKRYLFDMLKMEADELKSIQKDDVIRWYNTYLRSESPKCRRLAIHVWGCNTGVEGEVETQAAFGDAILDLAAFKRSNKFYPSLC